MNFLTQRRKNIFFLSMLVVTFFVVFSTFLGSSYIYLGNLFDAFIAYNIGYAIQNNFILHETFHTSFGFVYGFLNSISLKVIDQFKMFEASDLIMISSVIFSIIVFFCFLGTRLTFNSKVEPVPYWILLVALPPIFQARDLANLDHKDIVWYGTYNHHLWGLLIVQIASLFCLEKFYRKSLKENNNLTLISLFVFSFMQALFSFIGLNYKINSFMASLLVSFGVFFIMPMKTRFLYVSLFIGFLGLLCGGSYFFGYNYEGYFLDIYRTIESQAQHSDRNLKKYKELLLVAVLYVFISVCYRIYPFSLKDLKVNSLKLRSFFNRFFTKISFKSLFFDLCVAGGLFFASYGSSSRPKIFFLIVYSIFILMNSKKRNLTFFSCSFLILFYIVNIYSLLRITQYKFYDNGKSDYVLRSLDSNSGPMTFVLKNKLKLSYILNFFVIGDEDKKENSQDLKNFKSLSYAYMSKGKMEFFLNNDYVKMMSGVISAFKGIRVVKEDRVMMLGFINPLPFLLGTSFPSFTDHWVDIGVTFSFKNIYRLERSFQNSDFIFMPVLDHHGKTQTILNCQFYTWNFNHDELFKIFKIDQYGVYFASKEKMEEYHLYEFPQTDDRETIIRSCSRVAVLAR